eukprot:gene12178-14253_t
MNSGPIAIDFISIGRNPTGISIDAKIEAIICNFVNFQLFLSTATTPNTNESRRASNANRKNISMNIGTSKSMELSVDSDELVREKILLELTTYNTYVYASGATRPKKPVGQLPFEHYLPHALSLPNRKLSLAHDNLTDVEHIMVANALPVQRQKSLTLNCGHISLDFNNHILVRDNCYWTMPNRLFGLSFYSYLGFILAYIINHDPESIWFPDQSDPDLFVIYPVNK